MFNFIKLSKKTLEFFYGNSKCLSVVASLALSVAALSVAAKISTDSHDSHYDAANQDKGEEASEYEDHLVKIAVKRGNYDDGGGQFHFY